MPSFKRRALWRRRSARRYKRRRVTLRKVAKKVRRLNKAMKAEIRYLDTNFTAASLNTTMSANLLNGIQTGDPDNYRQGSMVHMIGLTLHGAIYSYDNTGGAAGYGNVVRVAVVYDKDTKGAIFADTELNQVTNNPLSNKNWNNRKRFKILYNRIFSVDYAKPIVINKTIKLNLDTYYGGNTNTVADIAKGSLYLVAWSDSAAIPDPTWAMRCRLYYNP